MLIVPCLIFSQTLQPKISNIDGKNFFCFDNSQANQIKKILELSIVKDEKIDFLKQKIDILSTKNYEFEQIKDSHEKQIFNLKNVVILSEKQTELQKQLAVDYQKKVKRERRNKIFYRFTSFVLGAGLVFTTTKIILK